MNRDRIALAGAAAFLAALLLWLTFYTIDPTEQVIVLQFGAPIAIETEPGLHAIIPFVQTVAYIDKRLLNDEVRSEEVMTQDKTWLLVDSFARWRIVDPIRFNERFPSKEIAYSRLSTILNSDVGRVIGDQTFAAVLSEKRRRIETDILNSMNQDIKDFGIAVVDVRIRRLDFASSDAVYRRMQEELKRQTDQLSAEGSEVAMMAKARADREVAVITSEAEREASILRGEGDAEKTRILGEAYSEDPDFFAFYRSMQAYQDALPSSNTTAVLSPDSEFFRYFSQAPGAAARPRKR